MSKDNVVTFQAPASIADPLTELLQGGGSRTERDVVLYEEPWFPPYGRKSKRVEAALSWLYLKGIATDQIQEALEVLVRPEAARPDHTA